LTVEIRALHAIDREWVKDVLVENWGSASIVSRGQLHQALALPGIVADQDGEPVGLLLFRISEQECEIVALNSLLEGRGVGSALIEAVVDESRAAGCVRVWLVTTNDNLAAQRFYQKRGFSIVAVYEGAIDRARTLKPEIPIHGKNGIPIRDEVELELLI
jgi:ribosomal protein S18 acetylase RimI-like enzyme